MGPMHPHNRHPQDPSLIGRLALGGFVAGALVVGIPTAIAVCVVIGAGERVLEAVRSW